ncbi:MAG: hypothetical protein ACI8X3_003204, partial [Saprospiraceae bacterium]
APTIPAFSIKFLRFICSGVYALKLIKIDLLALCQVLNVELDLRAYALRRLGA